MEHRLTVGLNGAFFVQGIDPKDNASLSPFNTKYGERTPIMQFTGLKDMNGKEIYEGDIIKLEQWQPAVYQVDFNRGGFCFFRSPNDEFYNDAKYLEKCVVIGNIYENSDLLK